MVPSIFNEHMNLVSPVWFVMGPAVVEPTAYSRESFFHGACASPDTTGTLTAHRADTHLVRARF